MSSFLLYFTLRARTRFDPEELSLPIDLTPTLIDHTGAPVGSTHLYTARELDTYSIPLKGRAPRVYHTLTSTDALTQLIPEVTMGAEPDLAKMPTGLLYLEHKLPFGVHRLVTSNVNIYGHGLWSAEHEVLVLTDIENFDTLLRASPVNSRDNAFWMYRMRAVAHANVTLNTSRLCQRWVRWVYQSQHLGHPSQRFAALEQALFPWNPS